MAKLRAPAAFMLPYYSLQYNPGENAFLLSARSHNKELCTYDMYKVSTIFGNIHYLSHSNIDDNCSLSLSLS